MWTVGDDAFLHSFFSTVAYQVETGGWGSRAPALTTDLYGGRLPFERVDAARAELAAVRRALEQLSPTARVFEYEAPNTPTPWPVPPGAATLADCFLTASGDNLLDILEEVLEAAREAGTDVEIRPFAGADTYSYYVTGDR
jgi:hypothetical protein